MGVTYIRDSVGAILQNTTHMDKESQAPVNQPYLAAIGDLIGSRDMNDRSSVQGRVHKAIDQVNEELAGSLAAPIKLTGGDEWKVLLGAPPLVADVIDRISDALHPAQARWGIGWGKLATPLSRDVGTLDGPCFHNAREAIEQAAKERAWVRVEGFSPLHDEVLSALFGTLGALRASWTEHQVNYIRAARGRTQEEAAQELGISRAGIAKGLGRASYTEYRRGLEAIRSLLATYDEGARE